MDSVTSTESCQLDNLVAESTPPVASTCRLDRMIGKGKRRLKRRQLAMKRIVLLGDLPAFDMSLVAVQPSLGSSKRSLKRRRKEMIKSGRTTFPGKVVIEERGIALQCAQHEEAHAATMERVVLWTDGAHFGSERLAGAAVVYQKADESEWTKMPFTLRGDTFSGSEDSELFAVNAAIEIAANTAADCRQDGNLKVILLEVVVYCDSSSVLANISTWEPYTERTTHIREPLFRGIARNAAALHQQGVKLELRWVPGHSDVAANEQAHAVAQKAARACPSVSPRESCSTHECSLTC